MRLIPSPVTPLLGRTGMEDRAVTSEGVVGNEAAADEDEDRPRSCWECFFPCRSSNKRDDRTRRRRPTAAAVLKPQSTQREKQVLLEGCTTYDQHLRKIRASLEGLQRGGAAGLASVGMEFRLVPCAEHAIEEADEDLSDDDERPHVWNVPSLDSSDPDLMPTDVTSSIRTNASETMPPLKELDGKPLNASSISLPLFTNHTPYCPCRHSLFCHSVLVTPENRRQFIADGPMFDQVAACAQEYVHSEWIQQFDLEWKALPHQYPAKSCWDRPVRILTSKERGQDKTLLILTGRGKVQGGMFSRQHLMTHSIEASTAQLDMQRQKWRIIIVDPNARGESRAYRTVCESLEFAFANNQDRVFVLAHSASGGQLTRYWLGDDYPQPALKIDQVEACAFTDSTHNIQWAHNVNNTKLVDLLEGPRSVYWKSSSENEDQWYLHVTGEPARCDEFWRHRFGRMDTRWAGTAEHALTNWYAHADIWKHFEQFV